jgi:Protein of unknown function (DUF3759)
VYEHHREREGIVEHHALGKELLAGFAAAEVDKHFDSGRYGHLDREQARMQAQQQADHLWQQQNGREQQAADLCWALNDPHLCQLLVGQRGWTTAEFERWLSAALAATLLRP